MDRLYGGMVPLAAGGILSLLVQRKNQRNTPQAARPALRAGSASGPGISVRHIHAPYGNAVIHDGALRVLPNPLAVPHGDPKASKSKAAASDVSGVALGPPEVRQSRRVKPAGRRAGMCAVFGRGRMPRTKIPAGTAHPPRAAGGPPGCAFFCLLFFAQAKKSRAPRRARHAGAQIEPPPSGQETCSNRAPDGHAPRSTRAADSVAPYSNPSLPQRLPSVAAGR